MSTKKRVAVVMGGRAPEHDVSVVSGLQILHSIDTSVYDPFPVYIAQDGTWYIGEALWERDSYIPKGSILNGLTAVQLDLSSKEEGGLLYPIKKMGLFGKAKTIKFDIAFPVFHGNIGEDGSFQGLMELADIPYTGNRFPLLCEAGTFGK